MTYRQTNTLSNLYLLAIIMSGLTYTVFLGVMIFKIIPGFVMQIIFFLDSLKFGHNLFHLVLTRMFIINSASGFILLTACSIYLKAILSTVQSLYTTRKVVGNYLIKKITGRYILYKSTENQIFTAGILNPMVYVSTALLKSHPKPEIEAMLFHEKNHQNNYHPFKTVIIRFIRLLLPPLPGKNWLLDNYITLTEISSDQFSELMVRSKLPIVSALLKHHYLNPSLSTVSNYFNSQSERIKILVGQKKQTMRAPFAYAFTISLVLLLSAGYLKNTSLFFNCQHLFDCIKTLVSPNSQPLLTSLNTTDSQYFLNQLKPSVSSEHCQ